MADYYPVLKRAISSLPSGSGEARRVVYEKARAALVKQLQSYDPPLTPAEITDQRLALEECIRRVESEVAGAAFGLTTSEAPVEPAPTAPPPRPAAPDVVSAAPPVASRPVEPRAAEPRPVEARPVEPRPVEPRSAEPTRSAGPAGGEAVAAGSAFDKRGDVQTAPRSYSPPSRPAPADVRASMPPPTPSVTVQPKSAPKPAPATEPAPDPRVGAGMSALSTTLRQAETLGGASSQAVRNAREAIADDEEEDLDSPPAADEKIEPGFMSAPLGADLPDEAPRVTADSRGPILQPPKVPRREHPRITIERHTPSPVAIGLVVLLVAVLAAAGLYGYSERDRLAAWFADGPEVAETPDPGVPAEPAPDEPAPEVAAVEPAEPETPAADLEPKIVDRLPQDGEPATPIAPDARQVQTETVGPADTDLPAAPVPDGAAPSTGEAGPGAAPGDVAAAPQAAEQPQAAAPDGATGEPAQSGDEPVVLVAQRAILYEEPIPGSEGARVEGRVLWSFVNEPVLPGDPPVPQIRATVDVPDRNMRLVMSIRRNEDEGLPASHVVEMKFELPSDFAGRTIDTTPGLIMKQTEDARGDPLIGAVAKVLDNLFWLALSGADQDEARNIGLLRERQWVDVPIRYGNRRRAILTFEKGTPGSEVFEQAFAAWNAAGQ